MDFFSFFFSVRNNTLGSYKFFFYISSQFIFWLDFEIRSVNLEPKKKKLGIQAGVL